MANLTNFDPPRRGFRCSNRSLTRYFSHAGVVEWFGFIACATMILVRSFLLDWTTFRVHTVGLCRPARFIDCESGDEIHQPMHVLPIKTTQCLKLPHKSPRTVGCTSERPTWPANAVNELLDSPNTVANRLQTSRGSWHLNKSQQFSKMSRNVFRNSSSMFLSPKAKHVCSTRDHNVKSRFLRLPLLVMLAGWLCRRRSHICSLVRRDEEKKKRRCAQAAWSGLALSGCLPVDYFWHSNLVLRARRCHVSWCECRNIL